MTNLEFIQGDPAYALQRLKEGGAVIVAREFLVAQGLARPPADRRLVELRTAGRLQERAASS